MRDGHFGYEFAPDPTAHPSFQEITNLVYRLAEFCELVRGVVPGFSVRMSHMKMSGYTQHVLRNHVFNLHADGTLSLKANLSGTIRNRVYKKLHSDIFDLA